MAAVDLKGSLVVGSHPLRISLCFFSGIPEIKCFLNGVKRANWLTMKTMIVKVRHQSTPPFLGLVTDNPPRNGWGCPALLGVWCTL